MFSLHALIKSFCIYLAYPSDIESETTENCCLINSINAQIPCTQCLANVSIIYLLLIFRNAETFITAKTGRKLSLNGKFITKLGQKKLQRFPSSTISLTE